MFATVQRIKEVNSDNVIVNGMTVPIPKDQLFKVNDYVVYFNTNKVVSIVEAFFAKNNPFWFPQEGEDLSHLFIDKA
jgi:type I site-specific restriction endonuclease